MHTLPAIPTAISHFKRSFIYGLLLLFIGALSACDRLGFPDPAVEIAAQEANAKATGSACRHAGRAIEDCYSLNPKSSRSSVFAGWKEMNDYMRENKMEEIKPNIASNAAASSDLASESASASSEETSASAHDASAEASNASSSEH